MPFSRLVGYYCVLMLLCGLVFARWLPVEACMPSSGEMSTAAPPRVTHKSLFAPKAPLLLSERPSLALMLPGKN